MREKEVPFFSYLEDNTHCYQSIIKMILKYYFPNREYSWEELERMSGKKKGLWTWQTLTLIEMKNIGFEIKVVGIFDYDEFIKDGYEYLKKEYGRDVAEQQRKNTDLNYEIENIKKCKGLIDKETRLPDISDIIDLIDNDYLIECSINANHSILVYGVNNDCLLLHDPGPPPKQSYEIKLDRFNDVWACPNDRVKSLTAFKYINRKRQVNHTLRISCW